MRIAWLTLLIAALLFPSLPVWAEENQLNLDAEAAILMDSHTGQVLYEKNSHERMFPASITKIVTATVAIESGKLDEVATVSRQATVVEGTKVYLDVGEQKTIRELLYALLLHSGNDAANVIAEHIAGSQAKFAEQMNAVVEKVTHSKDTHFVNPHGLFDKDHYVTAHDMALLSRYAMQHPLFREIVGTKDYQWDGKKWKTKLVNQNQLLWRYTGTNGMKNGFLDQSLNTLVTSVNRDQTELIAVVLKDHGKEKAYEDTTKLMDYGFAHYEDKQLLTKEQQIQSPSGTMFQTTDHVFATVKKGENATYEVSDQGVLTVKSGNNVQSVPDALKPVPVPSQEISPPSTIPWWIYGVGLFLIVTASFVIRLKVRQDEAV
ncbi:MAG TPA: D-alanyl-D-alanine carboxypeptidase family protein [Bacillota bacterium]|nr:D-alanyl-D-alanine carboxypeptidase family protein [Bacillota bacterium]